MTISLVHPKEPPHSVEAEQSVLGGIIRVGSGMLKDVSKVLKAEMFFIPKHQKIYTAIESVFEKHGKIDIVLLAEHLDLATQLELVGNLSYLTQLVRNTPETSNVLTYAAVVRERFYMRQIETAYQQRLDPQEIIALQKQMTVDVTGRSSPRSMNEFLKLDLPKPQTMLDPWLGTQSQNIVFADAGVGKTFFTTDIGFAVATGGRYLKWAANQRYNVLLVDSEMPRVLLQERYRLLCSRTGVAAPDNFHILSFEQYDDDIDLIKPYWQQEISNMIDEYKINLLILDNISTAFNRDDNKQSDWQPAKQWLKRLRNVGNNGNGIAQILVMHAGKNGTIRGTSSISDTPDIIIKLVHPEDYDEQDGARFEVHWKKHRHLWGTDVKPFQAHLVLGKWECSEIEVSKSELPSSYQDVLDCVEAGITNAQDIAIRLGKEPKRISEALAKLTERRVLVKLSRGAFMVRRIIESDKSDLADSDNPISNPKSEKSEKSDNPIYPIRISDLPESDLSDSSDKSDKSDLSDFQKINDVAKSCFMPTPLSNEGVYPDIIDRILVLVETFGKSNLSCGFDQIVAFFGTKNHIPANGRWIDTDSKHVVIKQHLDLLLSQQVIRIDDEGNYQI